MSVAVIYLASVMHSIKERDYTPVKWPVKNKVFKRKCEPFELLTDRSVKSLLVLQNFTTARKSGTMF